MVVTFDLKTGVRGMCQCYVSNLSMSATGVAIRGDTKCVPTQCRLFGDANAGVLPVLVTKKLKIKKTHKRLYDGDSGHGTRTAIGHLFFPNHYIVRIAQVP